LGEKLFALREGAGNKQCAAHPLSRRVGSIKTMTSAVRGEEIGDTTGGTSFEQTLPKLKIKKRKKTKRISTGTISQPSYNHNAKTLSSAGKGEKRRC